MAKVDTDKFIAKLIELYCERQGIDRKYAVTYLDDVLEDMGFKVENGEIKELEEKIPSPTDFSSIGNKTPTEPEICKDVREWREGLKEIEDAIEKKAEELGQKYFPDEQNIWARANIEAQSVRLACLEMITWYQDYVYYI